MLLKKGVLKDVFFAN